MVREAHCASVQRFRAAVSEVLRLWSRACARLPRLSTARLRLLETVSRRRKQRPGASETGSQAFSACACGQNAESRLESAAGNALATSNAVGRSIKIIDIRQNRRNLLRVSK